MFGWRKKTDGFVWNEYVKTTILHRREQRRQRIEDMREAAVDGLKEAGRQGVAIGVAGANAAGRGASRSFNTAADTIGDWVTVLASATWLWLKDRAQPFTETVDFLLSRAAGKLGLPQAWRPRPGSWAGPAVGVAVMLVIALGTVRILGGALMSSAGETVAEVPRETAASVTSASGEIEGRVVVLGPDLMRIGSELVALSGVEAPVPGQPCAAARSCVTASKAAFQKLAGGKRVTCAVSARRVDQAAIATCKLKDTDIAAELVRTGYLFAEAGYFAAYTGEEREARSSKAGLWKAGETVRPEDYRAQAWSQAKDAAPGGCPIKGIVSGSGKTYVLPGAPTYAKAKVREDRGERWFCTEAEARAAGWKPAVQS